MFGLHNVCGKRIVCYVRKGDSVPEICVVDKDNYLTTFIADSAISGRETLPLIEIHQNCKVNADYYISNVLKPLLEVQLHKYHPNELPKKFVHHGLASSHTPKMTFEYARNLKSRLGISILPNSQIPVKSPDASQMDFFGFGYSKRRMFQK
jgi:hypothetical protein